jgi:cobalt transporter subunit CbtA
MMRAIPSPSPATDRTDVFRRVFFAAVLAGLAAGFIVTALQAAELTPLIAAAEFYEKAETATRAPAIHEALAWEPSPGIERIAFTLVANMIIGVGFGLLLSAAFALHQLFAGAQTDARRGLLWGLAGFACFSLAPALGLPPELPGSAEADLFARQSWWIGTALATAAGIGLIAFVRPPLGPALGLVLIALPHLVGAPRAPGGDSAVPAGLAAEFAAASVAIAALFWLVLGSVGGWLYARLGRRR